jgi:hypothetical protein
VNEIASSAQPFIDQIPKRDRTAIEQLEERGRKVVIRWTSEGWRYEVNRTASKSK